MIYLSLLSALVTWCLAAPNQAPPQQFAQQYHPMLPSPFAYPAQQFIVLQPVQAVQPAGQYVPFQGPFIRHPQQGGVLAPAIIRGVPAVPGAANQPFLYPSPPSSPPSAYPENYFLNFSSAVVTIAGFTKTIYFPVLGKRKRSLDDVVPSNFEFTTTVDEVSRIVKKK